MPATIPDNMPVTLAEAKAHLRITHDQADTEILGYLLAATEYAETRAQRIFRQRTLTLVLDDFPGLDEPVVFDLSPVQSITTIQYYDEDNATQTHTTAYLVEDATGVSCLYPNYDTQWPNTVERPDAVTITYVAGYSSVATVPQRAKNAIMMLTKHGYDQRDPVLVGSTALIARPLEFAVDSMIRSLKPGNYPQT
jgi:uncharacterized phiE125 gp8 family phage protein